MDINKLFDILQPKAGLVIVEEALNNEKTQDFNIKLKDGNLKLMLSNTGYYSEYDESENLTHNLDQEIILYGLTKENHLVKIRIEADTNKNFECNFIAEGLIRVLLNKTIGKNKTIEEFYQDLKKEYEQYNSNNEIKRTFKVILEVSDKSLEEMNKGFEEVLQEMQNNFDSEQVTQYMKIV